MRFIKVTEFDRALYVPVDQIAFLKSKESETEIFLKNRADALTVKEPLAEVIKNMQTAQTTAQPLPPSERVIAVINGDRRVRPNASDYLGRALNQNRTHYRGQ